MAFQCIYVCSNEGCENQDTEEGNEIYGGGKSGHDLIVCVESEEDPREMVGRFVQDCRSDMKINSCKSKVMVMGRKDWSMKLV